MMSQGQESARRQSDFYRDRYHGMLRALFISVCIMLLLIGAIIYFILFTEPRQYYATTPDGLILQMQSVQTTS